MTLVGAHTHDTETAALAGELAAIEALLAGREFARPLLPHEHAAHVDFAGLANEVDTFAQRLADRMVAARASIVDAADIEVRAAMTEDRFGDWLRGLGDPAIPTTLGSDVVDAAYTDIHGTLTEAAHAGYARVVDEAHAQGVPTRHIAPLDPHAVADTVDKAALRLARDPQARVIRSYLDGGYQLPSATMTPDAVAEELRARTAALSDTVDVDTARQEAHRAAGVGRNAATDGLPTVAHVYASELLDRNTCGPCSLVDGHEYPSTSAAREDYPDGRYRDCEGGPRCRGTLVFVWSTEAEPTVGPGDNPPLPPPPAPGPVAPTAPGAPTPAPAADGSWLDRLSRLRAQTPTLWAPSDAVLKPAERDEWARRLGLADPTGADYERFRAALAQAATEHEALVRQAGQVVHDEVDRRVTAAGLDRQTVRDAKAAADEAATVYKAASDVALERSGDDAAIEDLVRARDEMRRLRAEAERLNTEYLDAVVEHTRAALAEARPMGPTRVHNFAGATQNAPRKIVEDALNAFPTDWVDRSAAASDGNPLLVKGLKRGHYTPRGRSGHPELAISGPTPAEKLATASHEFGHRVESIVDGPRRLEASFYRRRVTHDGVVEPNQRLSSLTGNRGYGRDEVARPDEFVESYIGKDYGGAIEGRGNYEVLSMGSESVLNGRYNALLDDVDMRTFILGVFTLV